MWAQRCIRRKAEFEPKSGYEPGKCSSIISALVPFQALALIPLDDEFRGSGCKSNNLFLHKLLWVSVFITIESTLIQILQPGEWGQLLLLGQ